MLTQCWNSKAKIENMKYLKHQSIALAHWQQLNSTFLIGSVSYKAIQTIYSKLLCMASNTFQVVSFGMCENLILSMLEHMHTCEFAFRLHLNSSCWCHNDYGTDSASECIPFKMEIMLFQNQRFFAHSYHPFIRSLMPFCIPGVFDFPNEFNKHILIWNWKVISRWSKKYHTNFIG